MKLSLIGQKIAERALQTLREEKRATWPAALFILLGRVLQIQEESETAASASGQEIETIAQTICTLPFAQMSDAGRETALEILRSLPVRTALEIRFVLQLVQKTPAPEQQQACISALQHTRAQTEEAWDALATGSGSPLEEVRAVVAQRLQKRPIP